MDFRQRLASLVHPPASACSTAARDPAPDSEGAPPARAAPPGADAGCAPPAPPRFDSLPFFEVQARAGALHLRRERLGPARRVGRVELDPAWSASSHLLALLALDPSLTGADLRRALFLDIETTGLGGAGALPFLVGVARRDDDGEAVVEQALLAGPEREPALLDWLSARLGEAGLLVTFNGKTFDLPMLAGRYVMHRLPQPAEVPHLDLLQVARRLHRRRLGACRLGRVEGEVLGLERLDDVEGAEIGARYRHYLRTGDDAGLAQVVEHNALDVLSMVALVSLYGEPLERLHDRDLPSLARTLHRAGATDRAAAVAERAVARGVGVEARRTRGDLALARGERDQALLDYEQVAAEVPDPMVRLALAKLYEHHVRDPRRALAVLEQGTGERPEAAARRRARLERKLGRLG